MPLFGKNDKPALEPLPVWSERAVSGDLAWQEFRHWRRGRGA